MTTTTSTSNRPEPSGPICAFGSRLGYTYFPSPAPHPDQLNKPTTTTTTTGGEGGDYWFTIDDQLVYLSFYQDYGPLNIGCVYRFCLHLHNLLEDPNHRHQRIFLYSSDEPDKKVNAALLMSLYAMVVMRWSVADVLHPISSLELQPYRDAGYSRSDYHLHPQQILYGLSRALSHQLLDLSTFDLAAYEKAEKVEEGDWNWITPGFIAFASPVEAGWNSTTENSATGGGGTGGGGRLTRSFRNVLEEFENKNVRVVVRLNKKLYDRNHFLERGIDHVEMYFDDGTNPTMEMCREFIDLSDRVISTGGAVAVHCKAGLGRTGTLIGAYLIYKHGFTADEAIGFMRLMRPGSCVGPQQHFLYENQLEWVRWSAQDELRAELSLSLQNSQPQPSTSSTSTSTHNNVRDCSAPPRPITPPNESELREAARQRSLTPHVAAPSTHTSNSNLNAPVTPRRQTGNVVPGQPRKTPGKSRHGISAPEEKDKDSPNAIVTIEKDKEKEEGGDEEMEEALREEEEMEGVVLNSSPNKKKRDSIGGRGDRRSSGRKSLQLVPDDESKDEEEEEEEEDPLTMLPSSPRKPLQHSQQDIQPPSTANKPNQPTTTTTSTRPKTPSAATGGTSSSSSNRPTRIARSSAATTPNATTTVDQSSNVIARSRGAKNLNTVFESVESGVGGVGGGGNKAGGPSTRSRYPLRNVSGRTTPTMTNHSSSITTTSGVPGVVAPNSPSKLPTRIPAKRGVPNSPSISTSTQSQHQRGGFDPSTATGATGKKGTESSSNKGFTSLANGLAKLGGGGKAGGRNVRRRRSSMGSQDFVQAG